MTHCKDSNVPHTHTHATHSKDINACVVAGHVLAHCYFDAIFVHQRVLGVVLAFAAACLPKPALALLAQAMRSRQCSQST